VRRRLVLLFVVSAATAAAVAYYIGRRSREIVRGRDEWEAFAEAAAPTDTGEGARFGQPRDEEAGPTEAAPMVVATMEATSQLDGPEHNGAGSGPVLVEPELTHSGTEAALGAIQLEPMALPRRRRISGVTLAVLGALAGAGAIALGAWGIASSIGGDDNSKPQSPTAVENVQQVVSLIAKPTTATIPLSGSQRRIILVVGARGYGVLVLNGVTSPPAGKTYEAWVIRPNVKAPFPAGLFTGGTGIVKLTKPVPPGAVVAITVEPAGGSAAPTQKPKLAATRT
jgi:Anti-sigma-K factor rskA